MQRTWIVLCVILLSTPGSPNAWAQMSPLAAEREALRHREQIQRLHLVMTVENAVRVQGQRELLPLSKVSRRDVKRIWMDGESNRVDRASQGVHLQLPDGSTGIPKSDDGSVEYRGVSTPERSLFFMATPLENSPPPAVQVIKGPKSRQNEAVLRMISDVRMLGMVPMPPSLMRKPVGVFVGRAERSDAQLVPERLGDIETLKSSYRRHDDKFVALWMAPDMGFGIVRAEFWSDSPQGHRRLQRVTSQLRQYDGGIWFPAEVEYMCFRDDERVEYARITVENVSFNQPIDPTVFTLEGLQVEPNTVVARHGEGTGERPIQLWDGAKLVDLPKRNHPNQPAPVKPQRSAWGFWFVGLNLLAAIVCLMLYVRGKRRAARRDA